MVYKPWVQCATRPMSAINTFADSFRDKVALQSQRTVDRDDSQREEVFFENRA